jgi:hypothetical protein
MNGFYGYDDQLFSINGYRYELFYMELIWNYMIIYGDYMVIWNSVLFFFWNYWLVVLTILKNMSSSMGRMTSHIWNGK